MSYRKTARLLTRAAVKRHLSSALENPKNNPGYEKKHIDCLLNPGKYPPAIKLDNCTCNPREGKTKCEVACRYDAISRTEDDSTFISPSLCVGCRECIDKCEAGNIAERIDQTAVASVLNSDKKVYAMIAPAFTGQFSENVTPGKLRTAFKLLGFEGMVEVALFADILTLKEALHFDRAIQNEEDYMLTSCCCPIWYAAVNASPGELKNKIPHSVSPMVACGRTIKKLHPDSLTVFIGPCLAKKAEAQRDDKMKSVDFVMTFKEASELFEIAGINPELLEEDDRFHSSEAGICYAYTGGVSRAVEETLKALIPDRKITFRGIAANGIKECKSILKDIEEKRISANFYEGMGCEGGCVGGPGRLKSVEEGKNHVSRYGKNAEYKTPVENPYVTDILHRLGFESIEALLEDEEFFER